VCFKKTSSGGKLPSYEVQEKFGFEVNISCVEANTCQHVCALFCANQHSAESFGQADSSELTYNGTCIVVGPDSVGAIYVDYDPDELSREQLMAQYYPGHNTGPKLEELALEYIVPATGSSATEVRVLEVQQEYVRLRRDAASALARAQQLRSRVDQLDKLRARGMLGPGDVYLSLSGQCLNLTQEQYVGTTAVREQWHTFHYDLCFFDYATQYEVKAAPDAAAAYDESGQMAAEPQTAESEPERITLGRPVGFLGNLNSLDLRSLEPLWFKPSEHLFLFAMGAQCAGGVSRALAVQFICGLDVRVLRLAEVRMCAYLADVSHPGPCDLDTWPGSLRDLARRASSLEEIALGSRRWLQNIAPMLRVEDGILDWRLVASKPLALKELLLARLGPGPGPPLVSIDDLYTSAETTAELMFDLAGMLGEALRSAYTELPPTLRGNISALASQARVVAERAAPPWLEESRSELMSVLHTTVQRTLAIISAQADAVKSRQDVAAALAMASAQAEVFEARRPLHRRCSVPSAPADIAVLLVYLGIILLAAFRVLVIVMWVLRELWHCCCCCCCSSLCCRRRTTVFMEHQDTIAFTGAMEEPLDKDVEIEPRNLADAFEEEYNIIDAGPDLASPTNADEAGSEHEGICEMAQKSLTTGVTDGSPVPLLEQEPVSTGELDEVERIGVVDE